MAGSAEPGEHENALKGLAPDLARAVSATCAGISHNLNGQKLGRKGRVTRERILAAALRLLDCDEGPMTLSAVAREASLGMTSLYNYFTDMTELALAVLEPVMATSEEAYLKQMRAHWPNDALFEHCYRFAREYHNFWMRHSRLLHLRNALADQQDLRMMQHRVESTRPIIRLILDQMGEEKSDGNMSTSMATMVMIGLERSITLATDAKLRTLLDMPPEVSEDRYLVPGARLLEFAIRDSRTGGAFRNVPDVPPG